MVKVLGKTFSLSTIIQVDILKNTLQLSQLMEASIEPDAKNLSM